MSATQNVQEYSVANGEAEPLDFWPNLFTQRRGPGCGATSSHLVVAGGVTNWDKVLVSVELFSLKTKAHRMGGSLQQARAYFQMIPVGAVHPRLLAVGGQDETSTLDSSEWWDEGEDNWQEGPQVSIGRANFGAVMARPDLVCPEKEPLAHSCPAGHNSVCIFSSNTGAYKREITRVQSRFWTFL